MFSDKRNYKGVDIRNFIALNGTTQWQADVVCHSGCCDRLIERGTLKALIHHIERAYPHEVKV